MARNTGVEPSALSRQAVCASHDGQDLDRPPLTSAAALVGWIALSFLPALGAMFARPGEWYQSIVKPAWNPPTWLFAPVWTLLYLTMGVAVWLVWRRRPGWRPLRIFLLQLGLNALWTPVFFGAHQMGAALAVIGFLWVAIGGTIRAFWRVSRPAAWMLVPYFAWVSFATFLNFTLWRLNS